MISRDATTALAQMLMAMQNIPDKMPSPEHNTQVRAATGAITTLASCLRNGERPNVGAVLRFMNELEDASG